MSSAKDYMNIVEALSQLSEASNKVVGQINFDGMMSALKIVAEQLKPLESLQGNLNSAFLDNADVPIDNSAAERSIRTFCIGKKNWMFHNTANGAKASALVYSILETAKINNLRPYY